MRLLDVPSDTIKMFPLHRPGDQPQDRQEDRSGRQHGRKTCNPLPQRIRHLVRSHDPMSDELGHKQNAAAQEGKTDVSTPSSGAVGPEVD